MKRIGIVGGGPGGLFAAWRLQTKCVDPPEVTIFEAAPRLGGKLTTRRFEARPVPYEAGAAEIYQYGDDPLRLLIKEILGLPVERLAGHAVVMDGHLIESVDDLEEHYGPATARAVRDFDRLAHKVRDYDDFYNCSGQADNLHPWSGRTFASVLDEVPDADARRYLKVLIHSDLATEPEQTTALYGVDNYLINDPAYCKLYAVRGGMDRLVEALGDAVSARVELETPVTSVAKAPDGVSYRITYNRGGAAHHEDFDAVAVALPMAWLPKVRYEGDLLAPAMESHVARYDYPAHYLRISVLFRRPFWRDAVSGSFFMIDAFGGCCVYDEGTRLDVGDSGVLSWLVAGDDAERMAALSDADLIDAALGSLPDSFGPARDEFLEGKVHRWLGCVCARPGGAEMGHLLNRHQPEPVEHPNFFVVGDYMFDTSLNGALDSADYMTDLMLTNLNVPQVELDDEYFDAYVGERSYSESFQETFDASWIVAAIREVWGARPPFTLLDAGSANGLTLPAFDKLRVVATGVENHAFVHATTAHRWKASNHFGDVRRLPFADLAFDFVHDTTLAYVPEADLPRAIAELSRVARVGVIFGSVNADMRPDVIHRYDLLHNVKSLKSLDEWSAIFRRHGFATATIPGLAESLGAIRTRAYGGKHPYAVARSLGLCFLAKAPIPSRLPGRAPRPSMIRLGVASR